MTIVERNNKLKCLIACLKCEVSGKPCNANCSTQYEAGKMGEIIENLEAISKELERETASSEQILNDIVQIVKNNEYPEYIECDLVEYLENKGYKL